MPTYEYRCPNGHDFEQFYSKISDSKSVLACPECGAEAERRISGGAGLLFKGSGFYITDYGKDGKKDQAAAKSSPSTTANDGGGAKSAETKSGDAKPAEAKSAESKTAPAAPASKPAPKPSSGGE